MTEKFDRYKDIFPFKEPIMAITLTEAAANEIKTLFESQEIEEGTFLRMAIAGGGCSGLQYGLGLDTEFDPDVDTEFINHGVRLVTGKQYALHLDGTTIDFKDGPFGRGFAIDNPNYPVTGGCAGCGKH
jgi:iron-sulfur cluster assembly protein